MTIMNGRIRAELTQLLADHLNEQHCIRIIQGREYPTGADHFKNVAVDAMDFMYGGEDDHLQEQEQQKVEADPNPGDQGNPGESSCCNGFTCGCCPGSVDRLEGGPITRYDVHQCNPGHCDLTGVMLPEPVWASFVYLDRPSRPEAYVPLRGSDFGQTPRSPQGSDSGDA